MNVCMEEGLNFSIKEEHPHKIFFILKTMSLLKKMHKEKFSSTTTIERRNFPATIKYVGREMEEKLTCGIVGKK